MPDSGKTLPEFREAILAELDTAYDETGDTPDLMFVSHNLWRQMDRERMFERKAQHDDEPLAEVMDLDTSNAYVGMYVLENSRLDERGALAVLMSWDALKAVFPKAKGFYSGRP